MKILVGYDGTELGNAALELARKHARGFQATVYLVTSLEEASNDTWKRSLVGIGTEENSPEYTQASKRLENAKVIFEQEKIPCITSLSIRGLTPGEDIVEFAKENQIDEIVIGAKSRSKVDKFLFGSNTQYIIIHADCPVVTVKQ
jgi:nucleotide-binding universal stress UspA family protein